MPSAQNHRISCPLCLVGHAVLMVETHMGEIKAEGLDAVKCVTCKRYFKVRAQVQFVGVPIEENNRKVVALGRG